MSTFKAIQLTLKQSYDKQNLTHVVISYEIYEMTTSVRSSIFWFILKMDILYRYHTYLNFTFY